MPLGLTLKYSTFYPQIKCMRFHVSHNKWRHYHTVLNYWFFVTEIDSVYCAVRIGFLNKTLHFVLDQPRGIVVRVSDC